MGQRRRDEALQAGDGEVLPERPASPTPSTSTASRPRRPSSSCSTRPGKNPTRASLMKAYRTWNQANPFLLPGNRQKTGGVGPVPDPVRADRQVHERRRSSPCRSSSATRRGDVAASPDSRMTRRGRETPSPSSQPLEPAPGCSARDVLAQYCSICVIRVDACARGRSGATFTARTIHSRVGSADVEHVEAARRLLEAAEEHALARAGRRRGSRGSRRRARRRARCPTSGPRASRSSAGSDAVEELADRLAAEEPLLVRDDRRGARATNASSSSPAGSRRTGRRAISRSSGHVSTSCPGATSAAVSHRARQAARDHAVERPSPRGASRRPPPVRGPRP